MSFMDIRFCFSHRDFLHVQFLLTITGNVLTASTALVGMRVTSNITSMKPEGNPRHGHSDSAKLTQDAASLVQAAGGGPAMSY